MPLNPSKAPWRVECRELGLNTRWYIVRGYYAATEYHKVRGMLADYSSAARAQSECNQLNEASNAQHHR